MHRADLEQGLDTLIDAANVTSQQCLPPLLAAAERRDDSRKEPITFETHEDRGRSFHRSERHEASQRRPQDGASQDKRPSVFDRLQNKVDKRHIL